MDEETQLEPEVETDPLKIILAEMQAMKKAMGDLATQNQALQEKVSEREAMGFADNVPSHLKQNIRGDGKLSRAHIARSVVVMTRPVAENPTDYSNVVDGGNLIQNNLHNIISNNNLPNEPDEFSD
jgi:hypothetical protein